MAEDYISLIGEDGLKELDLAKKSAKELADIVVDTNSKIADMYSKLKSNKSFAEFNKIAGNAQSLLSGLRSGLSSYEQAALKAAVAEKQLAAASRLRAQAQGTANAQARVAAEGFKDLKQSVRDIAGELPSLSGGISNFFKAIAGKIPGLIEQMVKAKEMNEALAASGKRGIPVWKQMAAGIFSWQTALVVGVSLLANYSDEIVDFFTGNTEEAKKAKKANEEFAESLKQAGEAAREDFARSEIELKTTAGLIKNVNLPMSVRLRHIDELRNKYPGLLDDLSDEAILTGKLADAVERINRVNKAAAVKDIAEKGFTMFTKNVEEKQQQIDEQVKVVRGLKRQLYELNKTSNDEARNIAQKRYDAAEKMLNRLKDELQPLQAGVIVAQKAANAAAAQMSNTPAPLKSAPANTVTINTTAPAQATPKKDQLSEIKQLNDELKKENDALAKTELETDMKNQKAIMDNEQASLDERMAARWQYHNGLIALAEMEKAQADKDNEDKHTANMADIAGIQDKNEREKLAIAENERYKKQHYANIDELSRKTAAAISEYADESEKDIVKSDNEAAKFKLNNLNAFVAANKDAAKTNSETWEDHVKELKRKFESIHIAIDLFRELGEVIKNLGERRIQGIDDEIERIQERKDAELAAIEDAMLSEDEKNKKKALVEAEALRKTKEAEKARLRQRAARLEKGISIVSIIAKTAEAVLSSLSIPIYGEIKAIAAAAVGAAELAAVIASPIPEYAEGTADHPGGPARIGEGGESELVIEPGRRPYWINKDTLVPDLAPHAQVIPLSDMVAAAGSSAMTQQLAGNLMGMNMAVLSQGLDKVVQTIKDKQEVHYHVRYGEMMKTIKNGNITVEYLHNSNH